ncbi:hypothetical protein [Marinifilum sp. D737]|uniref:hypothetical protein n=1 Tax=Marinifilum sp. D737 TaxID=2969628 RepID=UPI002274664F|nr:hypothetical protein [Marinifilum sp. D737]MCY1636706.1 hypothetical protein [Marinifilum sp. D737]
MKVLKVLILTLISFSTFGQTEYFERVEIKELKSESNISNLDVIHSYEFEDLLFVVGHNTDNNDVENIGLRLCILNDSNEIIFKSDGQQDSYYFEPHIFQSSTEKDRLIIIGEIGAEYSWGAQAFLLEKNNVIELGSMDVGIIEKPVEKDDIYFETPSRIIKYLEIESKNNEIKFSFKKGETLAINPGGDCERKIKSENFYFIWKENQFLEVEN